MRRVLLALLAAACVAGAAAIHTADVESNYFPGHSGQILIVGEQQTPRDSHAVLLDPRRLYSSASAPSALPLTSLTPVLAHALGMGHLDAAAPQEVKDMMPQDEASKSKQTQAQIVFNVESVGKSTVDHLGLSSLSSPSSPHVSLSLSSPAITPPASSLSVAASLATGLPVSAHGVVGSSWKDASGAVIDAYDARQSPASFAQGQTLAELVATRTGGAGFTLSMSASEQLARAFATSPQFEADHAAAGFRNNYCVSLTDGATRFRPVGANQAPALHFDLGQLEATLRSSPKSIINNLGAAGVQASLEDRVLRVSSAPSKASQQVETARFDLRKKSDAAFVAELQYALELPGKLQSIGALAASTQDHHADLIVVSFASFTGLIEAYGRESEQLRAALRLFNALFPLLSSEYGALFPDSRPAMQSLVLMGAHPSVLQTSDPRQVEHILRADNVKHLEFYPNLYLPAGDVARVCDKLNKDLARVHFAAYCPSHKAIATHAQRSLVEAAAASEAVPVGGRKLAAGDAPSADDVQRYQIVLWFSIVFAFILLSAVYTLATMSFKKDTMLYSSFNPNWEERKRR